MIIELVRILEVDHKDQRYNTIGDWKFHKELSLLIKVSRTSDIRYSYLIAVHELIEAMLCENDGITQEEVDQFDMNWEKPLPEINNYSEPGDDPRSPYYNQHQFASAIEMLLAQRLGVNWARYEEEINKL